ncbi:uncharacterized protein F5Z01DRAFT_641687 [Emericellopsis atlantica]|uniref:Uncharacterized protein n=1 Tax=Emericellopsis atlantica TaxID=2614577 RepID=A0A9P7ZWI9_9HYPO|nr:uncharacterized protein F5Z01DRAFT_641687 [Emericellopsis atlantica]KAG9258887.1 hypothetical protein F5Z01DRAFT_641687 [Emericellopsis atlantica]
MPKHSTQSLQTLKYTIMHLQGSIRVLLPFLIFSYAVLAFPSANTTCVPGPPGPGYSSIAEVKANGKRSPDCCTKTGGPGLEQDMKECLDFIRGHNANITVFGRGSVFCFREKSMVYGQPLRFQETVVTSEDVANAVQEVLDTCYVGKKLRNGGALVLGTSDVVEVVLNEYVEDFGYPPFC